MKKELELRISCSYGPGRYDPSYEAEGHDYPSVMCVGQKIVICRHFLNVLNAVY
jgi:hypothetical protein